jgi:hypothetical protein
MAEPTPSGQTPATPDPASTPVVADPAAPPADPKAAADPALAAKPADPKPEPAKPTAPEKYDFKALKLPDGVKLNEPILAAIEPIFRKYGLTQEAASELITEHAKALAKVETDAEATRESDFKAWMKTTVEGYHATLRKEWGAGYDANMATAQKGMAKVFSAEASKLLDETGLGTHPEFVKAFLAVGKMVSEDTPPNGQQPTNRKSDAEVFYGAKPN